MGEVCAIGKGNLGKLIQDFRRLDRNDDRRLTSEEAPEGAVECFDENKDGALSLFEIIKSNQYQLGIKVVDGEWLELADPGRFDGKILPAGTKIKLDDNGEIRALKRICERDENLVYEFSYIKVKGGTPVEFDTIRGLSGIRSLAIVKATLAVDTEFWVPNHFFSLTNGHSYGLSIVTAKGGTEIEFGRNGKPERLTLAEDRIIQGRQLKAGDEIRFDGDGRLIAINNIVI